MLAKAGIHYAKINEKMDSHFRGNDKSGSFFCYRCFCVTSVINQFNYFRLYESQTKIRLPL